MKPSITFTKNREAIRKIVESGAFRLTNPRVFGSVLHGTDKEGSDLDLLVDRLPGCTLLDLAGLRVELRELLGVKVDALTPGSLPDHFRDEVIAEARPL